MKDLRQQKRAMREAMKALRDREQARMPDSGARLRDVFLRGVVLPPRCVVAVFRSSAARSIWGL